MSTSSLTVNMKATVALIISFMIFFVVSIIATLVTGPLDIYAVLSVVFFIPSGVLLYFCRKRKSWAFIGTSILGIFLIVAILVNASLETWQQTTPLFESEATILAIVLALMTLEGFKAYVESKNGLTP